MLERIWRKAWELGEKSAKQVTQANAPGGQQQLQNLLMGAQAAWAAQIARTTITLLAKILGQVTVAVGVAAAIKLLRDALKDDARGLQIAMTEITRLMAQAAMWVYRQAGVQMVRWEIEPGACPECVANHDQGPHPLGVPFISGAPWPPQHVRCRCALVPA